MKSNDLNSRRSFMSALVLGTAATTLAAFTNPLQAALPTLPDVDLASQGDADKWFEKVKGSHRIAYDGSTHHDGFPIIWTWAFYVTNHETGTVDEDMTAVCVLRHSGIPFAFKSSLWEKYDLGKVFEINDKSTNNPSIRNLYYEPQVGDFPMPIIEGIKKMQERGAMFCVCNLAIKVYSSIVAAQKGLDATTVYQDWVDAIHPGIQLVPSGVWALGRAQEKGCGYIFAGG